MDRSAAKGEGFHLPLGTVTLLLGDIQGSTRRWETDGAAMTAAIVRFDVLVNDAVARNRGVRPVEQGEGDSFVAAFARAGDAVRCALDLQRALEREEWPQGADLRVRIALHTGDVQLRDEGNYVGTTINRAARVRALGHGGQTLLSSATADLVADDLPPEATLTDVGVHRLRDLTRPERVFQLGHPELPAEFPPLRSLDALPNNLPAQVSSFVGRRRELAEVGRLLGATRLLTLTGSGGCGKTRLALQAAADELDHYPDGVWFCDLARITDAEPVALVVARAAGIPERGEEASVDVLAAHFRDQRVLLILDNCEHLVDPCASLADELLRRCPTLAVLATSREPLGVRGETTWRVPSLEVPRTDEPAVPETLEAYDAVRLFVDRATECVPGFTITNTTAPAVAGICQRLDGIPLAIELAAARMNVLTAPQVLAALDDRFRILTGGARTVLARQQTLLASVDWSHELLSEAERCVLRRMSSFAGSFTLEAAEAVCAGGPVAAGEVLSLVAGLVEKSLVVVDEASTATARYRLLETVRQYASDRLAEAGEEALCHRAHRDYFTALVIPRPEPEHVTLPRIAAEMDNLRLVLQRCADARDSDHLVTVALLLARYWELSANRVEARRWLLAALASMPATRRRLRAHALRVAATFSMGDAQLSADSKRMAQEAVEIFRDRGEPGWTALALVTLAEIHGVMNEHAEVGPLLDEALEVAEDGGPADAKRYALHITTQHRLNIGDLPGARGAAEQVLQLAAPGDHITPLVPLVMLGCVAHDAGNLSEATVHFERALTGYREHGAGGVAFSRALSRLAIVRAERGEQAEARDLLRELTELVAGSSEEFATFQLAFAQAEVLSADGDLEGVHAALTARGSAIPAGQMEIERKLANVCRRLGDLDGARRHLSAARALASPQMRSDPFTLVEALIEMDAGRTEEAEALAHEYLASPVASRWIPLHGLYLLGVLAARQESPTEAARLLAAADRLRREMEAVVPHLYASEVDGVIAALRDALGDDFTRAWTEGAAMPAAEAVAYARRGRGERKRPSSGWAALTPTELDVVGLVVEGLTNPEIAERLFVSRHTVKTHLSHVFAKLGVRTRAELVTRAHARGTQPPG